MPLVDMTDMLGHAYRNGYAVGAFDVAGLEFLEAIVSAAEQTRSPVILTLADRTEARGAGQGGPGCDFADRTEARGAGQGGPGCDFADRTEARGAGQGGPGCDFELLMAATEAAARVASVPVAIQLDHGGCYESAVRAINLGCNGVMVDAAQRPFADNIAATRALADMAHACGVAVEGGLGCVAGEDAEQHPGSIVCASVEEAKAYVEQTRVDFLALSIGTVPGRRRGLAPLDYERAAAINRALGIPLAAHAVTGLADEQYRRLIELGVAKISSGATLADQAGARMRANAAADGACSYTGLVRGVRAAIQTEVERMMRLLGAAGRAEAVRAEARAFNPIEHVIVYNVTGASDAQVAAMMARGREVLAKIPGVRRVITGWAVTEKPKYRFCWLIEFVHANVIASYRDHPDHVAFANEYFRPIAGDRVSIDFAEVRELPAAPTAIHPLRT